jgi:large-conductance mechanosensitive channel
MQKDAITELKDTDLHTVNYTAFVLVILPFLLVSFAISIISR